MRTALVLSTALLATGCRQDKVDDTEGNVDTQAAETDADGDGYPASNDCNDADASIHPGAAELCDGLDNDCDDGIDENPGDPTRWYLDADLDGYGNSQFLIEDCEAPQGYVDNPNDCNDSDATAFPGGEEICDGADNDCDGATDEADATDQPTWYEDADGDGYGQNDSTVTSCTLPHGHAALGGDCDDSDSTFHPGATEADCTDSSDYNCDGSVGHADADADGFAACEDCDDSNGAVNDDATEVCNGIDDDCNGLADSDDPGVTDASTFYGDADGDGYGGEQFEEQSCTASPGYVSNADDCNDLDPATHPGANETCDEADNDCDSQVDEGVQHTWYADTDGDGYGDSANPVEACTAPVGFVANGDDCDDANPQSSPASYEICDGADNDCDGTPDNDPLDATDWYADADGDGYGDASSSTTACDAPTGFVADFSDCDDSNAAVSPGAAEACDGTDNDCDGATDEADAFDASTWYTDADGDSYGDSSTSTIACNQPTGSVLLAGDCNDADSAINPGATEVCDGIDNDCNGTADGSDSSDATNWYLDGDSDGYGLDASTVAACSQPGGYVAEGGDCNDADSTISPGATEACDAVDNNCNGLVDDQALGIAEACAAADCNAILADVPGIADGNYWVDPEEDGANAFEVYCDMSTGGGGWTLLLNLDTSDGHVMWWANDLWTDTSTHGDVGTPFTGDHKSQAYMDLSAGSRILVLVHENGSIVGWKSFDRATSNSLYDAMQGGDNTLIGASVADSDTANVWSQERLVNDSTSLYANHCLVQGSSCVNASGSGHSDGDRIASDESTPSGDNGGGLGNWHDMHYCCSGQTYAGHSCNGSAFRTTSEAQAGWSYSTQGGTFGSDSFGTMTGTQTDSTGCSNANWAEANGFDYDYAVFFGQ